jgi:DNA polymerase-3 subunit delta
MMSLRPPVFWKEKTNFRTQLKRWSPAKLSIALAQLLDAEVKCKSSGSPAELVAAHCLMSLAASAGAKGAR